MKSRYYTTFLIIYLTLLYATVVMAYKPLKLFSLIFPGGILIFPMTYFINDAIAEIYGYKVAKKIVFIGFVSQFIFVLLITLINLLPSPAFWHNQHSYNVVIDPLLRCVISMSIGITVGAWINTYFISKWKVMAHGRHFWIRSIGSSIIGETALSIIVFTLAFLNIMPFESLVILIISAWLFKIVYAIFMALVGSNIVIILKKKEIVRDPDLDDKYQHLQQLEITK